MLHVPCTQVIAKFTLSTRQALAAKLLMATSAQYVLRHLGQLSLNTHLKAQLVRAQHTVHDCIVPLLASVTTSACPVRLTAVSPTTGVASDVDASVQHSTVSNCARSHETGATPTDAVRSPPLIHVRMLLLGRAGTGKSQVLRALRFFVDQFHTVLGLPTQNTVHFCAPTGCAAALLRAQTVHSLLGVNVYVHQRTATRTKRREERVAAWSSTGLVVVDEVSMVPTPMHDVMGRVVAELRHEPDTMYGDVSVCWCGDMRQFPPPNMMRHGGRWFDSDDVQ